MDSLLEETGNYLTLCDVENTLRPSRFHKRVLDARIQWLQIHMNACKRFKTIIKPVPALRHVVKRIYFMRQRMWKLWGRARRRGDELWQKLYQGGVDNGYRRLGDEGRMTRLDSQIELEIVQSQHMLNVVMEEEEEEERRVKSQEICIPRT